VATALPDTEIVSSSVDKDRPVDTAVDYGLVNRTLGPGQSMTLVYGEWLYEVLTTTRTIKYVGAGDQTPGNVVQTIEWQTDKDLVTEVTTYTPQGDYPAVTSPTVTGYTADPAEVPSITLSQTTTTPLDSDITVTYTATGNTDDQTINVVFVDDDAARALVSVKPPITLIGTPGTAHGFAASAVPENYVLASIEPSDLLFDSDSAVDQEITVHLKHAHETGTVTTTRTIKYVGAGDQTPAEVVQTIEWQTDTDLVTKVTTYTPQGDYPAVTSPTVTGYTPDPAEVPSITLSQTTTTPSNRDTTTVTYLRDQIVNVVFVDDDDAAGARVSVASPITLTGTPGTAHGFTPALAAAAVPTNYVLDLIEPWGSLFDNDSAVDQQITVHLKHAHETGTVTTTRTIKYVGAGDQTPPNLVQTIEWQTDTDLVTGDTTYKPAQGRYSAVASPTVNGYTATPTEVPSITLSQTTAAPSNLDTTVTYLAHIKETGANPMNLPLGGAAGVFLIIAGILLLSSERIRSSRGPAQVLVRP
jgi:hypothetical protein